MNQKLKDVLKGRVVKKALTINTRGRVSWHPRLGASWEGFALEQVIRLSGAAEEEVFYWGVHNQAELDLLLLWRQDGHSPSVTFLSPSTLGGGFGGVSVNITSS